MKAQERGIEDGEYLYALIREKAEEDGMICNHDPGVQILHQKGKSSLGIGALWRCKGCGMLYYKMKDGTQVKRIEKL